MITCFIFALGFPLWGSLSAPGINAGQGDPCEVRGIVSEFDLVSPEARTGDGLSLLHLAVKRECISLIPGLLETYDFRERHSYRLSAWDMALQSGNVPMIQIFLTFIEANAPSFVAYDDGLIDAVVSGNMDVVNLLLEHRFLPGSVNGADENVFHHAYRRPNILERILASDKRGINQQDKYGVTPIYAAAREGYSRSVELFLEAGAIVDTDKLSCTLLWFCARSNNLDCARDIPTTQPVPCFDSLITDTPLIAAIENGNLEMIMLIAKTGAYLQIPDKDGLPPVFYAIENPPALNWLIDQGLDVHATDKNNNNVVMFAAQMGMPGLVQAAIQHGVDPKHKNDRGETALSLSIERGCHACADVIRKAL